MREYDDMVARQTERDGVRTQSGHHIPSDGRPTRRRNTEKCPECGIGGGAHRLGCPRLLEELLNPPDPTDRDPWVDRRDHYER